MTRGAHSKRRSKYRTVTDLSAQYTCGHMLDLREERRHITTPEARTGAVLHSRMEDWAGVSEDNTVQGMRAVLIVVLCVVVLVALLLLG